jgi:membrane protease subunit HflC
MPKRAILAILVLLAWTAWAALFEVDVQEYGAVSRFGAIVRVVAEPGLHAKAPFDRVIRLDRRLLVSPLPVSEYLTVDKKNVTVSPLLLWRISDPGRFLATLRTREAAETRLGDIVLAEIGAALGNLPSAKLVTPIATDRRYAEAVQSIRQAAAEAADARFGVEILSLEIAQLSLPAINKEHVFERMKAERGRIAAAFRSEGDLEAKKIIAAADRERAQIDTDAAAEAAHLRADGDAEAARIYAGAFAADPSFYAFSRILDTYRRILDEKTTLFLPAEAEILRALELGRLPVEPPPTPEPLAPGSASAEQGKAVPR